MALVGNEKRKYLRGVKVRKEFEQRVVELVDGEAVDLCESYKNGVFRACDEYAERRKGEEIRETHGDGMSE